MPYPAPTDPDYCPGSRTPIPGYDGKKQWYRCPQCKRLIASMGKQGRFYPHVRTKKRARRGDAVQEGLTAYGHNSKQELRGQPEPRDDRNGDSPTVRSFLDLSTSHLPDNAYLATHGDNLVFHSYEHGWLLWVPDEGDIDRADVPEVILTIQRHARQHGCDYVLFDADAPVDDILPTWDW